MGHRELSKLRSRECGWFSAGHRGRNGPGWFQTSSSRVTEAPKVFHPCLWDSHTTRSGTSWKRRGLWSYRPVLTYFTVNRMFCILDVQMWNLVPQPGVEPLPPVLGVWSLSHWTSRAVLNTTFYSSFAALTSPVTKQLEDQLELRQACPVSGPRKASTWTNLFSSIPDACPHLGDDRVGSRWPWNFSCVSSWPGCSAQMFGQTQVKVLPWRSPVDVRSVDHQLTLRRLPSARSVDLISSLEDRERKHWAFLE